jgi:hypothetical protein
MCVCVCVCVYARVHARHVYLRLSVDPLEGLNELTDFCVVRQRESHEHCGPSPAVT